MAGESDGLKKHTAADNPGTNNPAFPVRQKPGH